ncbi:hypothetical protein CHH28_14845 [Bacterioplanes sanyensis]|uniref:Uncharacterized protein n=1 Tax=Bacterioplanes sanyensis TaxID=1249553 RepID=A0A222FND1_9GAMM|nr:hypothetical protein [Bacterioplanes sanyensis]ASP39871.1 hypothetical protein CHH28_14845 [Bacterioplanes sanyensis]
MKKQFLTLAIAATTAMSSQAELIKYETSDIRVSDSINITNLELNKVEGATAWFETNEIAGPREPQSPRLKRLVIDMAGGLDNLVINDFDQINDGSSNSSLYEAKTAGWIFRDLYVLATEVNTESMRINISVKPNNNLHTQIAEFNIGGLQRTDRNPVVDIATIKANDKRLQLKLLERKQLVPNRSENRYVLEANWFGYGKKTIYLNNINSYDNHKAVGLELIELGHSELGQDYEIRVRFENSPETKQMGYLHTLLKDSFNEHGGMMP